MDDNDNAPAGRGEPLNRSECARFFGVAPTTIDAWKARGCPYRKRAVNRGKGWEFNSAEVSEWLQQQATDNATGGRDIDIDEARRRKAVADAELAEYELAVRKREVVPIEEAADVLTKELSIVRSKLLAVPSRLAARVLTAKDPAEAKAMIEEVLTEVLHELSSSPNLTDPRSDGPTTTPSS